MSKHINEILRFLDETGSTWCPLDQLSCFNVEEAIKSGEICYRNLKGRAFVTLPYFYTQEKRVARKVVSKISPIQIDKKKVFEYIAKFEDMESRKLGIDFHYAEEQIEGIFCFLENRTAILTGGPGTGKTSVLKGAATIMKWMYGNTSFAFTAPTGKAARRITEATGFPASTAQRYIGDSGMGTPLKMICVDTFISDEGSMYDLDTFEKVLDSISPHTCFYLVGDVDQLPSVGIGAVLRDLIDSKVVPYCQLEKTFRQDNSSVLFDNIQIVKKGGYVPLKEGADFTRINTEENALQNCINLYLQGIQKYGLDNTVILTPYRKEGTICSEKLNAILQKKINPIGSRPFFKTTVYRDEGRYLPIIFQTGDPVMQLENRKYISNGDVGYIDSVNPFKETLSVNYGDCIIDYSKDELNELDLAYALSIHKSQGSEYKNVIIPILRENKNVDRNSIYTAITRAKKHCCLIGADNVIMDACKVQSAWQRYTALADEIELAYYEKNFVKKILSA